jgi:isoleucyl-tRNA synthetase
MCDFRAAVSGKVNTQKIKFRHTRHFIVAWKLYARLAAPIAPFFMDRLFMDLNQATQRQKAVSVHLTDFPTADTNLIDKELEERMQLAQKISSMVLSLRKRTNIRVRQPLNKIMIPISDMQFRNHVDSMKTLILSEVNVKEIEYLGEDNTLLVKRIKPNFKTLGPRFGKLMKAIATVFNGFGQQEIQAIETLGSHKITVDGEEIELLLSDVEIITEDIPGWVVTNMGNLTVALDITITGQLQEEGIARELINRIQNLRKDNGFDVTDTIHLTIEKKNGLVSAIENNFAYICSETLAEKLTLGETINSEEKVLVELTDDISTNILVSKSTS